jgi:hypothetical protein
MTLDIAGKIHWPIQIGDIVSYEDAYETLFELSDRELDLSFWDEEGSTKTTEPNIAILNEHGGPPNAFFFAPLRSLLAKALVIGLEDDKEGDLRVDMIHRLLKALDG